jgi:hypothetical protein
LLLIAGALWLSQKGRTSSLSHHWPAVATVAHGTVGTAILQTAATGYGFR